MENAIEPIVPSKKNLFDLLYEPENVIRLAGMLGSENSARRYAQSVIALYTTDAKLRECSVNSIMRAAFQAASVELSVDPALRQAYIVPRYNSKVGAKEACFQPHYNGIITLALRTHQYRVIYVGPIYNGYDVYQDPLTGLHYLELAPATDTHPQILGLAAPQAMPNKVMVNVTKGKRPYEDIIGHLGYFETFDGFKYSVWMTQEEIEAHAKKHSEAYKSGYNCLWTKSDSNPHRVVMEQKTVLIALSKHMVLTGSINDNLRNALIAADDSKMDADDDNVLNEMLSESDGEPQYVTDDTAQAPAQAPAPVVTSVRPQPAPLPTVRAPIGTTGYTRNLTYEVASGYVVEGKPLKERTVQELEEFEQNPKRAQSIKNAIKIVRDHKVAAALVADLESNK